jgi:serine/threonine-protein kinase
MDRGLPALPAESKLAALVRLLGKPLEVPQSQSGWLQQQLPQEDTELLRRARMDLLVPIAVASGPAEALLALGPKRSEEPYSREDRELLVAIAASLAMLLEKPAALEEAPPAHMFEECPHCGTAYDAGAGRCARDTSPLVGVALPRLLADRYRLDRRLGRGGMGTVYAATDVTLDRRVAVKVIRDDLVTSAEAAERFRREARVTAAFAHPNVVTVYDFGAVGTRAFLVMELLEGSSLREEMRRTKRLPPARVLQVLRGVAAALEAAHQRNLVHRDLKPENIFLASGASGKITKVLDFGVAKFLPTDTQMTQDADTGGGGLMGTIRYMAPEQVRGSVVDPAWDLWALAVVAYEALTGFHPFPATSVLEFQRVLVEGRVTPIPAHLGPPAKWQEFFDRALAHDVKRRPQAAAVFFAELQAALG